MRRRTFLKSLLAASVAGAVPATRVGPVRAAAAFGQTLIVVFQRGGCDGLNMAVPYGDPGYAGLRPTIGVPVPGAAGGAIDLNGFFGLHPALAPLAPIYESGELAVMPAVHFDRASRSHFDNQRFIESGSDHSLPDGWLNRYLGTTFDGGTLQAAAFGDQLPHALRGDIAVSTIAELGAGLGLPPDHEARLQDDLAEVLGQSVDAGDVNRLALHQAGFTALDLLSVGAGLDPDTYQPANGAQYPESGFGRQLAQMAQLIKAGFGTEIATIDIGGWDTHSNQGGATGQQAQRLADFAGGLSALHTDMGDEYRDRVLVLTMTEFGRTAKENASRGTDHGKAGCWLALGRVQRSVGGDGIFGEWPGLGVDQLDSGRFLDHSLDYRDVMAEVLTKHLGATDLSAVLPGHGYQPVGFL